MATQSSSTVSAAPTLADYARSLWRRKWYVVGGVVLGALLGAFLLPKIAAPVQFTATARIEKNPLTADVLFPHATQSTGSTATGKKATHSAIASAPPDPSLVPDPRAIDVAIGAVGKHARSLNPLHGIPTNEWPGAMGQALEAQSISGTSPQQIDISLTNKTAKPAEAFVNAYANAYASDRNAANTEQVDRGFATLQAQANSLMSQIDSLTKQISADTNASTHTTAPASLETQLGLLKTQWTNVQSSIDQLKHTEAFLPTPTVVIGSASVTRAAPPIGKSILGGLGLILGLILGCGIALVIEAFRPKMLVAADVERAVPVGVLASVPAKPRGSGDLAVVNAPLKQTAEGFQRLRAELELHGLGNDVRSLAFVSPDRAECRTTVAANVATSLANMGRQVVLVSGDLRQPRVEQIIGISPGPGFAEALAQPDLDARAMTVAVSDSLRVLPAGSPTRNPAELLSMGALQRVIASLRAGDATVIFDTPAARYSADALVISRAVDAVTVTVRAGRSRMRSLRDLVEGLTRDDLRTLGAVLIGTKGAGGRRQTAYAAPSGVSSAPPPAADGGIDIVSPNGEGAVERNTAT